MTQNILHSHIRNLEVTSEGNVKNESLQNNEKVRKVLKIIKDSTRNNNPLTCVVKHVKGSGLSALLTAYQQECPAIRVHSAHIDSIETFQQYLRTCVKLKIKETKDVYEGEVVEMNFNSELNITLKTLKGSKSLKFCSTLHKTIQNESITVGDIIYVECNSGIIKRLGRSESCIKDNDLECEKYLAVSKGELLTKREFTQICTLHELDFANANPNSGKFGRILETLDFKSSKISDNLRADIDGVVEKFLQKKKCDVELSTLIIDKCNNLDIRFFAFLDFYGRDRLRPTVIFVCEDNAWVEQYSHYLKKYIMLDVIHNQDLYGKIIKTKICEAEIDVDQNSVDYLISLSHEKGLSFVIQFMQLLIGETGKITRDMIMKIEKNINM